MKQATFTGAQQRAGVPMLPFVVAGLFGLGRRRPAASAQLPAAGPTKSTPSRGRRRAAAHSEPAVDFDDDLFDPDREDADEPLPTNYVFDWAAYRDVFGNTQMENAVTAMFAEYAVLYSRIAGWTTSTVAPPMTHNIAKDLATHAEEFVLRYVTPILGVVQTPKIHKLLRHILGAIKLHGNLQNANTSGNESQHKDDKPFYRRTNKAHGTFTAQLVRQAQGSREALKRLAAADAEGERESARQRSASSAQTRTAGEEPDTAGRDAAGPERVMPAQPRRSRRKVFRLQLNVASLARRRGLATVSSLLNLAANDVVRLMSSVLIAARLNCGSRVRQLVRASSNFRGKPWYDAVTYDASMGGEDVEHVGEVRAIIRTPESGDVAIVCNWDAAAAVPGCPLSNRACERLQWANPSASGQWSLSAIPFARIRRVVHVVPDFADLCKRKGHGALPPSPGAPVQDLKAMRFFVNDFYQWG